MANKEDMYSGYRAIYVNVESDSLRSIVSTALINHPLYFMVVAEDIFIRDLPKE